MAVIAIKTQRNIVTTFNAQKIITLLLTFCLLIGAPGETGELDSTFDFKGSTDSSRSQGGFTVAII